MRYSLLIILLISIAVVYVIETNKVEIATTSASDNDISVKYDRKLYKHWIDEDRDCQNTRQEVLIAESVDPVALDERGCKVISGRWNDPFTGNTYTDPSELDVDHMVPLKEAHISGGRAWTATMRDEYANDLSNPDTLIAVSRSANRSKGARDVAQWLPPNENFHCEYVRRWTGVKETWGLTMDEDELVTAEIAMRGCS